VQLFFPVESKELDDHFFLPGLHSFATFFLPCYATEVHFSVLRIIKILDHVEHLGDHIDCLLDAYTEEFLHVCFEILF